MIIRLKQNYVDKRGKKPVTLYAGIITADLPREVMVHMVSRGLAEVEGRRQSGPERRKAYRDSKPKGRTTPYKPDHKKVFKGKTYPIAEALKLEAAAAVELEARIAAAEARGKPKTAKD